MYGYLARLLANFKGALTEAGLDVENVTVTVTVT
jgi:hypothetical protein